MWASWPSPPVELALGSDAVHVWRADLDPPDWQLQRLRCTLAAGELDRAGRYRFERERRRFIAARGMLRDVLGHYLHVEPGQVRFCTTGNGFGKPALAPSPGRATLRFNLAHSGGLALCAVAQGREVGVDLEQIRLVDEADQIAERFFSARECATIRALPSRTRQAAFFTCWTRKEAVVKAWGTGLALPLDRFDVSLTPGEPARLLRVRGDARECARWSLQELAPGTGYVAALAVEGGGWQLRCWQWSGPGQ